MRIPQIREDIPEKCPGGFPRLVSSRHPSKSRNAVRASVTRSESQRDSTTKPGVAGTPAHSGSRITPPCENPARVSQPRHPSLTARYASCHPHPNPLPDAAPSTNGMPVSGRGKQRHHGNRSQSSRALFPTGFPLPETETRRSPDKTIRERARVRVARASSLRTIRVCRPPLSSSLTRSIHRVAARGQQVEGVP